MENKLIYNTINHKLRNNLGLSNNEYILLDSIYQLQQSSGWCYASKEYLTQIVDIKERALKDVIDKLVEKCYIIRKDTTNRFLKVSDLWTIPFAGNLQKLLPEPAETAGSQPAETADYNNNIYNNIIYKDFKNKILKELHKINDKVYLTGNTKNQSSYWVALVNDWADESCVEHVERIIVWYVSQFQKLSVKGGDDFKFFPKAIIPSQLVEKWSSIERLYNEYNKEYKPLW